MRKGKIKDGLNISNLFKNKDDRANNTTVHSRRYNLSKRLIQKWKFCYFGLSHCLGYTKPPSECLGSSPASTSNWASCLCSWKTVNHSLRISIPATHMGDLMESQAPGFNLAHPGCYRCLGILLLPLLFPSLSLSFWSLNKKHKWTLTYGHFIIIKRFTICMDQTTGYNAIWKISLKRLIKC